MNLTTPTSLETLLQAFWAEPCNSDPRTADWTALSDLCHEIAQAKGFWDAPMDFEVAMGLVLSEMGEMAEADRHGKVTDLSDLSEAERLLTDNPEEFPAYFKSRIKDSVEDELADAVIRLLDYFGYGRRELGYTYDLTGRVQEYPCPIEWGRLPEQAAGHVYRVANLLEDSKLQAKQITHALCYLVFICLTCDVPLLTHIRLKLAYNQTRPRLHGKSY